MFVPPLFHPFDQRLAVALADPEGRMIYLLPFSPPYPFVFSHGLCSRVHDQPPAIFYPCAALLAVSLLCQTLHNGGNYTASFDMG